jgi:membrane protease YdiL (CAAX protease family)
MIKKGLFANFSPFIQLVFTCLTMLTCSLLFSFIAIGIAVPIYGIPIENLPYILSGADAGKYVNFLRYVQTVSHFSLFTIPAFFLGYMFSGNAFTWFGFENVARGRWFLIVFVLAFTLIPLVNLLNLLNEMVVFPESLSWLETKLRSSEEAAERMMEIFLNTDTTGDIMSNLFMIALLPAIGEELIFRGIFQKLLIKWTRNVHWGIILSAFLFSAMHMQFYGLLPRWVLGIMFGYLLVWSGSVWLPIFAHLVHNTLAVITSLLIYKGYFPDEIADYGSSRGDIPVTIVMTIISALLLWIGIKNKDVGRSVGSGKLTD